MIVFRSGKFHLPDVMTVASLLVSGGFHRPSKMSDFFFTFYPTRIIWLPVNQLYHRAFRKRHKIAQNYLNAAT